MVGHAEDGFCTKPTTQGNRRREEPGGWCPSRQAWPPRRDHHRNQPRLPARHGQRRQRVCRGFQGAFFSGGGCGRLVAGVAGAGPAPVCWRIEGQRGRRQPGGAPQPSHSRGPPPVHGPEERRGPRGSFPGPPGSAGRSGGRRRHRSTPEPDTTTTAATAARGDGGQPRWEHRHWWRPRQRQRTRTRAAGSCQQHPRQRQLFRFSQRSNNGAASGTCNRPGIAQFHGTAFGGRNPAVDRPVT